VPFALRAGGIVGPPKKKYHFYIDASHADYGKRFTAPLNDGRGRIPVSQHNGQVNRFPLPSNCSKVLEFKAQILGSFNQFEKLNVEFEVYQNSESGTAQLIQRKDYALTPSDSEIRSVNVPLDISVNPEKLNFLVMSVRYRRSDGAEWFRREIYGNYVRLRYEE